MLLSIRVLDTLVALAGSFWISRSSRPKHLTKLMYADIGYSLTHWMTFFRLPSLNLQILSQCKTFHSRNNTRKTVTRALVDLPRDLAVSLATLTTPELWLTLSIKKRYSGLYSGTIAESSKSSGNDKNSTRYSCRELWPEHRRLS